MRILAAFAVLFVSAGCYSGEWEDTRVSENRATGTFSLAVLDVGQGSAAVVVSPGGCVALLDGGPRNSGPAIRAYLRSMGVTEIAFAVTSHYHDDHIGGLDEVEQGPEGIPIRTVYDRGGSYSGAAFTEYSRQFAGRRTRVLAGQTLSLCNEVEFAVEAVDAQGATTADENARSVVVAVKWRNIDALAGGDLTGGTGTPNIEARIAPSLEHMEAYLVHHHGSWHSSTQTLLDAITPQVSVISVGVGNSYGHPAPQTVDRLRAVRSDIWQTEDPAANTRGGHVVLSSTNGTNFTLAQGARRTSYVARGAAAPCTTAISYRAFFTARNELRVYATSSTQPAAALRLSADGVALGPMTWQAGASRYEFIGALAARPRCVTVTADCGGATTLCY